MCLSQKIKPNTLPVSKYCTRGVRAKPVKLKSHTLMDMTLWKTLYKDCLRKRETDIDERTSIVPYKKPTAHVREFESSNQQRTKRRVVTHFECQ